MAKNYLGIEVDGKYRLRKPEFGMGIIEPYGEAVNWNILKENLNADENGFDTRFPLSEVILFKGTRIIRYGSENGRYTAPYGTSYECLSLPYEKESVEYHEYIVQTPTRAKFCKVTSGVVAEGFGLIGGGIQYMHDRTIRELLRDGIIKEDKEWMNNL